MHAGRFRVSSARGAVQTAEPVGGRALSPHVRRASCTGRLQHSQKGETMSRRRSSLLSAAAAVIASLVLTPPVGAQSLARLRGTVTDEQNAVVANARVVVRNQATGEERTATSDAAGEYQVASVPVGVYRVEIQADGFQARTLTDVRLEVAQTSVQNVRLSVGGRAEEVSVVGE